MDQGEDGFSKNLAVGFHDRGMGHGDFGIVDGQGRLIAKMQDLHVVEGDRREISVLPVLENAYLFAAAPELHGACALALEALKPNGNAEIIARLEAALKKSRPPTT